MINKNFLETLKKDYKANESERRQIISASNNILFEAKKTIFSLQRNDLKIAEEKISQIEKAFKEICNIQNITNGYAYVREEY